MSARRLRVLTVLTSEVRGGVEEHVLSLMQRLDAGRFELALACPPVLARALRPDLDALAVRVLEAQADSPVRVGELRRLWRAYRELRPDIVHCHLFRATLLGAPAAKAAGVPIVIETCHLREQWRRGVLKGGFVVDRLVARSVDRFIAVSEAVKTFLVDTKGYPAERITVIPNGRDLAAFHPPADGLRREVRAELGLDEAAPVAATLARLEPQKGHPFLLDAFAVVQRTHPRACLLLVGDGSLRSELETRVRTLGLTGSVRFTGFRRDAARLLAAADVAVLPSLYEGMPLMAIEALAMGKPLVATAVDGTPEVVRHEWSGLLVPPASVPPLAAAVSRLFGDPDLGRRLGAAGASDMRARFDLSRQVEQTEQLYLSLAGAVDGGRAVAVGRAS